MLGCSGTSMYVCNIALENGDSKLSFATEKGFHLEFTLPCLSSPSFLSFSLSPFVLAVYNQLLLTFKLHKVTLILSNMMTDSPIHLYSLLIRLSEPNAEFPMVSVAITGSGEPAEAALSEHNGLLLSCSSNKNRDSATKPAWCETETQPDLSTQPGSTASVQEFKPEGQTQDNNANKKTPWWEKIPGASRLFRQPSNNAIPAEFEQSNLCDDP